MGALGDMLGKKPKDRGPSRAAPAPVQEDPAILSPLDDTKKRRGSGGQASAPSGGFATASGISI